MHFRELSYQRQHPVPSFHADDQGRDQEQCHADSVCLSREGSSDNGQVVGQPDSIANFPSRCLGCGG
ncbi:hypothetical protein BJV74DRAFT_864885 [Russula compacta]|nr:hypothetical protein BJV74DRAFT_864885 [Russula compacta]